MKNKLTKSWQIDRDTIEQYVCLEGALNYYLYYLTFEFVPIYLFVFSFNFFLVIQPSINLSMYLFIYLIYISSFIYFSPQKYLFLYPGHCDIKTDHIMYAQILHLRPFRYGGGNGRRKTRLEWCHERSTRYDMKRSYFLLRIVLNWCSVIGIIFVLCYVTYSTKLIYSKTTSRN